MGDGLNEGLFIDTGVKKSRSEGWKEVELQMRYGRGIMSGGGERQCLYEGEPGLVGKLGRHKIESKGGIAKKSIAGKVSLKLIRM